MAVFKRHPKLVTGKFAGDGLTGTETTSVVDDSLESDGDAASYLDYFSLSTKFSQRLV